VSHSESIDKPSLAIYHNSIIYESITYGDNSMAAWKLSIVQEKGQVTIPVEIRKKLGLKKGDYVAFIETEWPFFQMKWDRFRLKLCFEPTP
jgi:AbrB family looped-hinge helix DNA binding protein